MLQFEKERHTLLCILKLLTNINYPLSLEKGGYPQFSFWISIALVKIYISYITINRGKNTFELVGTVLKRSLIQLNVIKRNATSNVTSLPQIQTQC